MLKKYSTISQNATPSLWMWYLAQISWVSTPGKSFNLDICQLGWLLSSLICRLSLLNIISRPTNEYRYMKVNYTQNIPPK